MQMEYATGDWGTDSGENQDIVISSNGVCLLSGVAVSVTLAFRLNCSAVM